MFLAQIQNRTEFYNQTTLHPVGLAAVLVLGLLVLTVPRRFAAIPMLTMACCVSPAQRVVIASLDFNLIRIMVLFGWLRIFSRGEQGRLRWTSTDTAVIVWSASTMVAYTLLYGTFGALINRAGRTYDFVGMYLYLRCVIRDWRDFDVIVRGTILLSLPAFVAFLIEKRTGQNVFAFLGGVPQITKLREGRLRCQGPFRGPVLAGFFWATLIPIAISQWWGRRDRLLVVLGVFAMIGIVILSASSTPLGGVAVGFLGLAMIGFRQSMRTIRWQVLGGLVALHFAMAAPVWHLVSRIDLVGGSTGYHRYNLIDQTIRRFDQWFLLGVKSTRSWGYGLNDVANQYVNEAVSGGIVGLTGFVVVLGLAFRSVGVLWRTVRRNRRRLVSAWALGASLFAQAIMFIAISISSAPQNLMVLSLVIALVTSLSQTGPRRRVLRVAREDQGAAAGARSHRASGGVHAPPRTAAIGLSTRHVDPRLRSSIEHSRRRST